MADITEKEIELIQVFRNKVDDVLENEYKRSPGFLVQWIRYGGHDLAKAEAAFRRTIQWRQEFRMDTITQERIQNYSESFPYECTSDKASRPVVVVQFGKWNIRREVECGNRDQLFRYMMQLCETIALKIQQQAEKTNGSVTQFSGIFDLDEFSFRQIASTKTIRFMTDLAQTAESNWPLIVNSLYLINAPSIVRILLSIVKPFMSSTTVSGIKVYNSNRADWQTSLLKRIAASELPAYYGGTKDSIFNRPEPEDCFE